MKLTRRNILAAGGAAAMVGAASCDPVWERRLFVVTTNRPAHSTFSLCNTVTDNGLVLTDCADEFGDFTKGVTW